MYRRTYCGSTIDTSKFNVFVSGLEFEDSYNSATAYQAGDVVTYGGYNYVAVQQSTGQTPYNNATYWEVLTTGFKMSWCMLVQLHTKLVM